MKTKILLTSALLLACVAGAGAKSAKRGVSENQFQFKAQMEALEPGITWYYSWGPTVGSYLVNQQYMEFVPMCWNGGFDANKIRNYVKDHPEVKYLLGFNEPNFTNQANMTPQAAADAWPAVKALAEELGLKLVAPALNTSPNPPYQDPTKWMDEFVALVGNDAFDYLAVHSYGGFEAMKNICTTFHNRYGKEVWLTEFCYWPEEGNPNSRVQPDVQIASMVQSLEWLEKTPWIFRYAWFKALGDSNSPTGPNYGLLLSNKGENPRELSEQGKVYLYMSEFDTEKYHPLGEYVHATEYISSSNISFGSNADTGHEHPIQVKTFNSGAALDYQFDVAEAGAYRLTLRVSGFGEPTRYDPSLTLHTVAADGSESDILAATGLFTLPNSEETYMEKTLDFNLPAGKTTLRIKDANPGNPSGLHISAVKLQNANGVEGVTMEENPEFTDVYSLQGFIVRKQAPAAEALTGLPAGIYIVNGKKVSHK